MQPLSAWVRSPQSGFENGVNGDDRLKGENKMSTAGRPKVDRKDRAAAAGTSDRHIAAALRDAYDEAVREDVPSEFLDLLGKLA